MIVSFSFANYRSFHEEQTFSMVANTRISGHEGHLRGMPNLTERLLPVAIFYGANGAGKTNFVRALMHIRSLVVDGNRKMGGFPYDPFALVGPGHTEPSSFELRVLAGGYLLEYGVKTTGTVVLEEWLVQRDGNKEEVVFERATTDGKVTVKMNGKPGRGSHGSGKIQKLAEVAPLPNQLFLHSVSSSIPEDEQGSLFASLLHWFDDQLTIVTASAPFARLPQFLAKNPEFLAFASQFLEAASTGVSNLKVKQLDFPPLSKEAMEALANAPDPELLANQMFIGDPATPLGIEQLPDGRLVGNVIETEIATGQGRVVLPFAEQSDGTQRLTHLLPAMYVSSIRPKVFIIDEIDRSLHPMLARKFIEKYLDLAAAHGSQLILTTHDTNLLDLDLLRRDEVWFAEKNKSGATEIYSLADFKVRSDLRVDKGYLHGRFGAIPMLGGMERLFPTQRPDEEPVNP